MLQPTPHLHLVRDLPGPDDHLEPDGAALDTRPDTSPDAPETAVVDVLVELLATLTAEARELQQAVEALRGDTPSTARPTAPAPRAVV